MAYKYPKTGEIIRRIVKRKTKRDGISQIELENQIRRALKKPKVEGSNYITQLMRGQKIASDWIKPLCDISGASEKELCELVTSYLSELDPDLWKLRQYIQK